MTLGAVGVPLALLPASLDADPVHDDVTRRSVAFAPRRVDADSTSALCVVVTVGWGGGRGGRKTKNSTVTAAARASIETLS